MMLLEEKVWVLDEKTETDTPKKPKLGNRPPKDGPCKKCGKDRPLNRLFLCYPCWVKTELEKNGWREGEPHPGGCDCDMTADHKTSYPRG